MNLPEIPGQNINGKNAASVAPVDVTTGQNIRFAASEYAA